MSAFQNPDVAAVYAAFPDAARVRLLALRSLLLSVAGALDGVGPLTETLKWGEPAYLTEASRSGSTIRLGWKASDPTRCAVYFNCQTTLVDDFRTLFPELSYSGNRAILVGLDAPLADEPLGRCLEMALTYHWNRRRRQRR